MNPRFRAGTGLKVIAVAVAIAIPLIAAGQLHDAPPPIQRGVARLAGWLCRRYVRAYGRETGADLSSQPYYEALRCAAELTGVAAYRLAAAKGEPHDAPRPIWDSIADAMLDYFDERTGVRLALPEAPAS